MDYLHTLADALWPLLPFSSAGPELFIYLLLGSLIGCVVGLLPGLGGATTMALLLPLTYGMDPTVALVFLLSVHSVAATTGDVTSVLFGIPGETTSAALVEDGFPMTRRGEPERAGATVLAASLVGAIFGAIVLLAAIPVVRPLVLAVASPEQFMLVLLAITYMAAVSGANLAKGLTMGAAGFVLSMIGLDPITSTPRFTLESLLGMERSLLLWDGLPVVVVALGLFGIPAMIDMTTPRRFEAVAVRFSGFRRGFRDVLGYPWLTLRGSVIGAYIGILPGIGGSLAQWIAYADAARRGVSAEGRRFGEGAIEGILEPAAANNSKEGGSLVPTVAFGVPGSLSTAILLTALMVHGVTPGPDMLDPQRSLGLTHAFVWTLVLANFIVVMLTLSVLGPLSRIARIRSDLMVPPLLALVVLGAWLHRGLAEDILLVLVCGLAGYLMVRFHWPRAPLLIGLLLGGVAETAFFISMGAYGWQWLGRPGVILLAILILAGVVLRRRRALRGAG
jgi:putative tricarboxylic transport membrane protein